MGEAGCAAVRALVPALRRELVLDAVIANGENSATGGRGITAQSGSNLLSVVDFLTLGNHAFDAEGGKEYLARELRVVRPGNVGANLPGRGWGTFEVGGVRVGVANVQGRVFMRSRTSAPGAPSASSWTSPRRLAKHGGHLVGPHGEPGGVTYSQIWLPLRA